MTDARADLPVGIGQHFTHLAEAHPDREAVVFGTERLTFAAVESWANRVAAELRDRGVGVGDWVAIVLPNCAEFWPLVVATWKLGAVPVPVSWRAPEVERDAILDLAHPVVTVTTDDASTTRPGSVALSALVAAAASQADTTHPDVPNNPWKAVGSGGSTGVPKLIVTPGAGPWKVMTEAAAGMFRMPVDGRELIAGPLYHNGPLAWGAIQLVAGGTVVVMPKFDAARFVELLGEERITWTFVVPTMMKRIMDLPAEVREKADLTHLVTMCHSAAPCPPSLKRQVMEWTGPGRLIEMYGSTEGHTSAIIDGEEWLAHPGSVGKPSAPVHILDEDGNELPTGEVGEIFAEQAKATFEYRGAEARRRGDLLSVGDLGWLDDDGYLYIADRRTDLIITGGANVYPAEVEAALLEHPAVLDVGVIGLPDDEWGARVHAIVQPRLPDPRPTEAELMEHCRAHLAPYKAPKSIEFVTELPRDPSGKLRRSQLRSDRMETSA